MTTGNRYVMLYVPRASDLMLASRVGSKWEPTAVACVRPEVSHFVSAKSSAYMHTKAVVQKDGMMDPRIEVIPVVGGMPPYV